jgi:hypothetical protein
MSLIPTRFRKIDLQALLSELSPDDRRTVEWDYEHRAEAVLPALPYTEDKRTWIALYLHCRAGQIDPAVMRRMKAIDLEYLAGNQLPAELYRLYGETQSREERLAAELQAAKLNANVTRATRELQRRYAIRIGGLVALMSVLLGAAVGRLL